MSLLTTQLTETTYLAQIAGNNGIDNTCLLQHIEFIQKLIRQSECIHNPIPVPEYNVKNRVTIWKCTKCGKVINIETNP